MSGLQQELWVKTVQEGVFPDNSFAVRSVDHSEFVTKKTVHVPNAGAPAGVQKNRRVFPAEVKEREDVDLSYEIDEYTVDPLRIPDSETVELSYNKRESVIRQSKNKLADEVHTDMIYNWIPESGVAVIKTTGKSIPAYTKGATGNRLAMTRETVEQAQTQFDEWNIPEMGRCMLLDARMYNQLMNSLSDGEKTNFNAGVDLSRGVIGHFLGFDFYKRSRVARVSADGTPKPWSAVGETTDCAAGLAWHEDYVSRALGAAKMFDNPGNPLFYSDILSFLQRAGGKYIFADKSGILLIRQDTAA